MSVDTGRRSALLGFGSAIVGAAALTSGPAHAEVDSSEIPQGAQALSDSWSVFVRLHAAELQDDADDPRSFGPMDDAALREVIAIAAPANSLG